MMNDRNKITGVRLDLFPRAVRALAALRSIPGVVRWPGEDCRAGVLERDVHKEGIGNPEIEWLLKATYAGPSRQYEFQAASPVLVARTVRDERVLFLTKAGEELLDELLATINMSTVPGGSIAGAASEVPRWDGRELRFRGLVLKRFKKPGPNQEYILNEFERQGWPRIIENPLPLSEDVPNVDRLHNAIKRLNKSLQVPILRFGGSGTGTGVCWIVLPKRNSF
jgi:hypothetical protein